jgi:hypothetical protein
MAALLAAMLVSDWVPRTFWVPVFLARFNRDWHEK